MDEVRQKYREKKDTPWSERRKKPNHMLALLTNVIKASLIEAYCPKLAKQVLDIGCGRGSDSRKFERVGAMHYIGTDLTDSQIEEGIQRQSRDSHKSNVARNSIKTSLYNISHESLDDGRIRQFAPFDVATAFLSLQYLFASKDATIRCLSLLSSFLKPQAFLLCILPDGDVIGQQFAEQSTFGHEDIGLYELCELFDPPYEISRFKQTLHPAISYHFSLKGSFSRLPESCLPSETFIAMAASVDLYLCEHFTFMDFVHHLSGARNSMPNSKITTKQAKLLWESLARNCKKPSCKSIGIGHYKCFVFRKTIM